MRGNDLNQSAMCSYVSPEDRIPADHPLRPIRTMADQALKQLSGRFARLYSKLGRRSVPPEQLLRALLLQVLYSLRSERMLMEQLEYNLLFRWFVGLNMDDSVWDGTVFSKNRERLLRGDIAQAFFEAVVKQAREKDHQHTSELQSLRHFACRLLLLKKHSKRRGRKPDCARTGPHRVPGLDGVV